MIEKDFFGEERVVKYDRTKLKQMIREEYVNRYGKSPSAAADNVIDCLDDAFLDEWRKEILRTDSQIYDRAKKAQREAEDKITELRKTVQELEEATKSYNEAKTADEQREKEVYDKIGDTRVSDALRAYTAIVSMEFDTDQQRLQNIQNASYIIWGLYANDIKASNVFLQDFGGGKVTDVEKESSESNKEKQQKNKVPVFRY